MAFGRSKESSPPRAGWLGRLGWILLSAFLICWAFVLGILVGQGSLASPEQMARLQGFLASIPLVQGLLEQKPPQDENNLRRPELSFYRGVEGDQSVKEPVKEDKKKQVKTQGEAPEKAAPSVEQKGRYIVQVASFKEEGQALGLVRQLKKSGLSAYLLRSQVEGVGLRFRVRVGPYQNLAEAQGAASRIRLQQKLAAYVTRGE